MSFVTTTKDTDSCLSQFEAHHLDKTYYTEPRTFLVVIIYEIKKQNDSYSIKSLHHVTFPYNLDVV